MTAIFHRLSSDDVRLRTENGERDRGVIRTDGTRSGALIYGPYIDLPAGDYEATIGFDDGSPCRGLATMDVCSDVGANVLVAKSLAAEEIRARGMNATLAFSSVRILSKVEIRLHCERGFGAAVRVVTIAGQSTATLESLHGQLAGLEKVAVRHPSRFTASFAAMREEFALQQQDIFAFAENAYGGRVRETHFETRYFLALLALATGRPARSVELMNAAIALNSDVADAHFALGKALRDLDRFEEALASFDRALALEPERAEAYTARGEVLRELNRLSESLSSYEQAIALQPKEARAHLARGNILRKTGDFQRGFPLLEWRHKDSARLPHNQPLWLGHEDLAGKMLFIPYEGGLGDMIFFSRYAKFVLARGAKVILSAKNALHGLLRTLDERLGVIGEHDTPEHFDYYCPLFSLPFALGTTLETVPASIPYLFAEPSLAAAWQNRLPRNGKRNIGLAWSADLSHGHGKKRSAPLQTFLPLLATDANWFSVLNELKDHDDPNLIETKRITHFGSALRDLCDTAALIHEMDLVISVDTSIAHLAGAMGKPVWIILPFSSSWTWLANRDDSPWYPTARLFRQPRLGDWASLVQQVETELTLLLACGGDQRRQ